MSALEHAVLTCATAATGAAAVAVTALAVAGGVDRVTTSSVVALVGAVSFVLLAAATALLAAACAVRRRPQLGPAVWAWTGVLVLAPLVTLGAAG